MLLVLATLRGGLYASLLPPWGLIDEEQHFHYVQHLAEQRAIPVVGQTYLSPSLVDAIFAARRWEVFHWLTPASPDPRTWGLEGHSYEGYQPPLFYGLLATVYPLFPDDILSQVYLYRWLLVGLSLLTLWITYRLTAELFPDRPELALAAGLMLVLIPERTIAVSRINNDVLLEVIAAAFIWVLTRSALHGLSVRRSQGLGLLLGLGLLTKVSMAPLALLLPFTFWSQRRSAGWWRNLLWLAGITAALAGPLLLRNWRLYGDPTGFAAFDRLSPATSVPLSVGSLVAALSDLFRYFWVLWWQGAVVGVNPNLKWLYLVLAAATALAVYGTVRGLTRMMHTNPVDRRARIIVVYLTGIGLYAAAVAASYFSGAVPIIQGRLMLPVIVPIVIVLVWAWWSLGRLGRVTFLVAAVTLVAADTLSLFGNLLPYFYYWSAFVDQGVAQPSAPLDWRSAWQLFSERLVADKPAGLRPLLVALPMLYGLWLAVAGFGFARSCLGNTGEPTASR
jgi:4-amino-4-deoxy-L-arabinose transferase-like glycosyltransferase